MEKDYLISVIMPAYNAEKTIANSIESVLKQTYANWELIIIDDGSKDDTEVVCKEYVQKDNRIHYVKKENGGVSTARNLGMLNAKGEFITFCDSDDYYEDIALEILLNEAIENSADYIIPRSRGVYYLKDGTFEKYVLNQDDFNLVVKNSPDRVLFEQLRCSASLYSTCGRMYRRSFLEKWGICFNEKIKILEDFCFNIKCLKFSKCTVHKSIIVYNYTVYGIEEYKFRRSYESYIISLPYVYKEIIDFMNTINNQMERAQIDFLMGYWVFAIEGILYSEHSFANKLRNIKLVLKEVIREDLYFMCSKEYLDTHFKVLFSTKSVLAFWCIYKLKKLKHDMRRTLQ